MTYAQVTAGTITAVQGQPPVAARRLDTQQWVLGLRDADPAVQEACGWFQVTDTTRPEDTPTTTHDRTLELIANVPTVVWVERAKTADELASANLVIAWLLAAVAAPAALIALLVPIRESGALLPQIAIAGYLRRLPLRKWLWSAGSVMQGIAVAGMALAAVSLTGVAAGWSALNRRPMEVLRGE